MSPWLPPTLASFRGLFWPETGLAAGGGAILSTRMSLDRSKLTAIGHADHVVCNPISLAKVDEVLDLLDLAPGARVLDAGCGKAEILMRLVEKHGVSAVGVDTNARLLEEARRRAAGRVPEGALTLVEKDVTEYLRGAAGPVGACAPGRQARLDVRPDPSEALTSPPRARSARPSLGIQQTDDEDASSVASASPSVASLAASERHGFALFDAALCTGSTHAFGGYRQTLRALAKVVRPGGSLLIGEGYWKRDPHADYLAAIGATRVEFTDHAGNVARAVEEGLVPLYSAVSSDDEWDRYEGLYLRAVERYIAAHPEDPDTPLFRDHIRRWRDSYLRWGRDTLGFGLYLFRT